MTKDVKKGDSVEWNSLSGESKGKVVKKITKNEKVKVGDNKTRDVKATKDNPKVLVKSDKSGKQAVHNPGSVKKSK